MEFIKKESIQPTEWENWFTTGTRNRSFDYAADSSALRNLPTLKEFLIKEQNELCAYCQQSISIDNSSIEHIIPKSINKALSTNYHNLIAVCNINIKDSQTNKLHCDKEKLNSVITPFILFADSRVTSSTNNKYFDVYSNGEILPKRNLKEEIRMQVDGFIKIVNLNHETLLGKRTKDTLNGFIEAYTLVPTNQKSIFWKTQFNRILLNKKQPFRQFLLIYIAQKHLGLN